jgi:hypothetical protein
MSTVSLSPADKNKMGLFLLRPAKRPIETVYLPVAGLANELERFLTQEPDT